ncbi:L-serine ammonia-lyase, iron-sulfur-dependent subunit beta [Pectinatus brassicae]|uniref:L-serine deaminase n=1 Tax=Pectinatus brassicae TaxID=862415 RepID=A0A840UBA3_9FIRM|nr:L-serine ammonia-lyase, iron-sulfur-dependent subunit beta [Pectinatus brassicae]MBB5334981.1 L-serine dehydratase [Pectinatus brassicae]
MGIFDIIGPVMIGPSSSHTAGAARIGLLAHYILKEKPVQAAITFFGSFAKTYRGHGTDKAIIAGLLGYSADDPALREAFSLAKKANLTVSINTSENESNHPNTAQLQLVGCNGKKLDIVGISLGGGKVSISQINGFDCDVSGENYTLLSVYNDQSGVVSLVSSFIAEKNINISQMRVFRKGKHKQAVMIIETDGQIPNEIVDKISSLPIMHSVIAIDPL